MPIVIGDPDGITWEGARAKVRGDLWRPGNSLPDDVVDRALHASVLELESETKWVWLESIIAIGTMDAPASYLDLPATVGRVSSVSIKRDASLDELTEAPLSVVRRDANEVSGDPSRWAMGDNRLWLDATAPTGTVFELIVTSQTPEVLEAAMAAAPVTIQRQQQATIANACHYIALSFMKNEDEAGRQRAVYERILERLLNVEADRRGGFIEPYTWGSGNYAR